MGPQDSSIGEGSRRRLLIIIGLVAAVALAGFAIRTIAGGSADGRMDALRADLTTSFEGTTADDFAEAAILAPDGDSPDLLDALTTVGRVMPDVAQVDNNIIRARYGFETIDGPRCMRVTWTNNDVVFETGSERQCTALDLS